MRHPDCDTLEALLGPDWACAGDYTTTDGIGVVHIDSGDLFSVDAVDDGYIVRDVEGTAIGPGRRFPSLPTLHTVATLISEQV